jgi:hypothetical protein
MYSELKIFIWDDIDMLGSRVLFVVAKDLVEARQILLKAIEDNNTENPTTLHLETGPYCPGPYRKEEFIDVVNSEPAKISPLLPITVGALFA